MADIYGQLVAAQAENLTSDPTAVAGRIYFKSDTGVMKYYDSIGTAWRTLVNTDTAMTNPLTTTGDIVYSSSGTTPARLAAAAGTGKVLRNGGASTAPAWAWPHTTSAKSADYTVTDTDGITVVLMTTGASNRTVTLPTAADNTDRILMVKKVDSDSGTCILDGEGSETIDGATTVTLTSQYDSVTIQCTGAAWVILTRNLRATDAQQGLVTYYKEGTWTPALTPSSGTFTSVTYSSQVGTYTRIGNIVFVQFHMSWSAATVGTAASNLLISGLPFTAQNTTNKRPTFQFIFNQVDTPASCLWVNGWINENDNKIEMLSSYDNAAAGAGVDPATIGSGSFNKSISGSGFYYV